MGWPSRPIKSTALALASRVSRAQTNVICCCSSGYITSGPLIVILGRSTSCSLGFPRISLANQCFKHCTPTRSGGDTLHFTSAVDCAGQGDLIGVFELAPHGDPGGDPAGSDAQRAEEL